MCQSAVDLGHAEKTLINAETQAVKSSEAQINWPEMPDFADGGSEFSDRVRGYIRNWAYTTVTWRSLICRSTSLPLLEAHQSASTWV